LGGVDGIVEVDCMDPFELLELQEVIREPEEEVAMDLWLERGVKDLPGPGFAYTGGTVEFGLVHMSML